MLESEEEILCQGIIECEVERLLFPLSLIVNPFMQQNYILCKTPGFLTTLPRQSVSSFLPCCLLSLFLLFSSLFHSGEHISGSYFAGRASHCLFGFNIQMLNLNSRLFRHHVRIVRWSLRCNFLSPHSAPCSQQPGSWFCISQAFKCL